MDNGRAASPGDLDWDDELRDFLSVDMDVELQEKEINELFSQHTDLKALGRSTEARLRELEDEAIQALINENNSYAELHQQLRECESALDVMDETLGRFHQQISTATDNIQSIQNDVSVYQMQLANRKKVETAISHVLSRIVIPPELIEHICSSEASDKYFKYLEIITRAHDQMKKLSGTPCLGEPPSPTSSCSSVPSGEHRFLREIRPTLSNVTLQAVGRLQTFLLQNIAALSTPKTNIQIKQQMLLRSKPMMTFLLKNSPQVAQEIKDSYVATLSSIYHQKLKTFLQKLLALRAPFLDEKDLITAPRKGDVPSDPALSLSFRPRGGNIMDSWQAPVVIPHVDSEKRRTHPYENLFRSMHIMLMDIITSEYIFTYDFFSDRNLYIPIFQKVIGVFRDSVNQTVAKLHDYLTLACCIRLTSELKGVMRQRKIPCIDGYYDAVLHVLCPQLEAVIKANISAIASTSSLPSTGSAILPLTIRYAEFSANLFAVLLKGSDVTSSDYGDWLQVLQALLSSMLMEVHRLLTFRKSSEKETQLFLVANLQHVLSTWASRGITESNEDYVRVEEWLRLTKTSLVELFVTCYIPDFVDVITAAEARLHGEAESDDEQADENGEEGGLVVKDQAKYDLRRERIDGTAVQRSVEAFGKSWEQRLTSACTEMAKGISRDLAADLITRFMMQVAIYNERMKKIVERCWTRPPFRRSLVQHQSMMEVYNSIVSSLRDRP